MSQWQAARRELAVAAVLVIALAAAAWVLLGAVAASIVALFCCAIALAAMRSLIAPHKPAASLPEPHYDTPSNTFIGFWRTQIDLADAIASMSAWDMATRPRMQNLLAARLAERHGISLAEDPEAARAVFLGAGQAAADLWYWIDPHRPTPPDALSRKGIPPRLLAALIHRLEHL